MVETNLSRYVGSSLVTSEKILMFVYFFCMRRILIIQQGDVDFLCDFVPCRSSIGSEFSLGGIRSD